MFNQKVPLSHKLYKKLTITERHRHRYEVNPEFKNDLISGGMDIVGTSLDGNLAEMIEIKRHPWFIDVNFIQSSHRILEMDIQYLMILLQKLDKKMSSLETK